MREILFRAKRKFDGEWVEGLYSALDPLDKPGKIRKLIHMIVPIGSGFNRWNRYLYKFFEVIPGTLSQFTGLKDKNGVKIFEGDILKCEITYDIGCYPHTETEIREVKYRESTFIPLNRCDNSEVIGNIHDNPELLKKEKN